MSDHGGSNFSFFLAGLGIGAIVALLMAPKAGSETRELIAKKADEGRDFARQKSRELRKDAESYLDRGKDVVATRALIEAKSPRLTRRALPSVHCEWEMVVWKLIRF